LAGLDRLDAEVFEDDVCVESVELLLGMMVVRMFRIVSRSSLPNS